ncbi:MAG: hypothetical protein K2W95_14080 [Candidatus Obscuribacterales bacterium]|nr:hypothetical protein [Candidatus Obscuribacterales bacterium]
MNKAHFRGQRSQRGSGIVEGVAGLGLVITGTICAVLLLVNCGMAMYHKNRLGYVALQTANYAASIPKSELSSVKTFAKELLQSMGANSTDANVESSEILIKGKPAVRVVITNPCVLLESGYDFLPKSIALSDAATCVRAGGATSGLEGSGFIKMPLGSMNQTYGKFVWIPVASVGSATAPPGPGVAYTPLVPFPVRVATEAGGATPIQPGHYTY